MNKLSVPLKEVDRVEILTVIDNYVDVLLTNTEVITRPPLAKNRDDPRGHPPCRTWTFSTGDRV